MLGTLLRPTDKEIQEAVENNKRIAGFRWGTMLVSRDARAIDPAASIFDGLRVDPDNVRVTDESVRVLPGRIKRRLALYGPFRRWM